MRLKSFYGQTMTEAMRLVREAMGDSAIIVATRDDPESGGVRVTAAIDETTQLSAKGFTSSGLKENGADSLDIIAAALIQHCVPSLLAEKILASATQYASEDPLLALGAALDTHFSFAPIEESPPRPLILVGPPGAGKTLCAAKLATKALLAKKKPALITADTERAGGMAQLAAFARVLKLEVMEIEDPHVLQDAISIQPKDSVILIDTAGCNPFKAEEKKALADLLKTAKADPCLVLPADLDPETAVELGQEFASLGAKRMISTRLDMTRRVGGLLKAAYEAKLSPCLFSLSSKVTESLAPLNPVSLSRLILPPSTQTTTKTKGARSA